ncbi:PAS domain S-box protein [Plectonema cf. radiosum LEGE 06105]|uniref:histidine kinase n=1 Tax=Plectonema cf. radiosum LEGE 06105 TaxID=945769 RepID=A0A8J7FME1_9CYAN|nr:PAS domain S-box protein [Plectonema radiosum]MBE9216086.1 PAS domain S-box protein [Plectonema cf. radiosum LEGE 06105]
MNKDKQINESSLEREVTVQDDCQMQLEENFSADFLLEVINGTSDPIFVKDRQHYWVLVNDAYCNFIGRSREEIIGKSDFDLFNKKEADESWEKDEFIFTTSNQNESDECITSTDGERRFVSIKKCVFQNQEGQKFLIVTIRELTQQITQHFQIEARLRSSKHLLEQVLNHIPQAVFWKDCDSVYQGCNSFFADIAGVGDPLLIKGKTDFDLPWKEEETNWFRLNDSRAIESKKSESIVKPQLQADGRQCWLEMNTIPICDAQGKVTHVLGTLQDITERKEIEVTLQQLYEELEIRVHQRTSELTQVVIHLQKEIKQREAIENQFLLSEEKLQKLSANVPGMLYQFKLGADGQFSFPYVSSGCFEIYEFFPEKVIADASLFISSVHRDEREDFEKSIANSAQSLQPWEWEGRIILASGKVKWIQAASRPEKQADGSIIWDGVVTDVTRLKQAERALKKAYTDLEKRVEERTQQLMQTNQALQKEIGERHLVQSQLSASRQRLALLIEQTPLAVIEWDKNFAVKEWNRGAEKIFGYTKEQAIGNYLEFIVSPTAQEQIHHLKTALLSQRGGTRIVTENITLDGKTIICEWYNNPLVAVNSEVIGVASMVLDITEREQSEATLQEQEQFLRSIYQGVEQLIFVVNVLDNGELVYADWNLATEKATGISASNAISKFPEEVFGDAQGAKIRQQYIRCLEVGIPITYEENLVFQGQENCWLTTINPLRNIEGKIYRIVGTSFNISERKQAETQLKQQTQELKIALNELQNAQIQLVQSEKMSSLGNLVAGVAHEINNPVNFIYGNIDYATNYTQNLLKMVQLYQQYYPQAASGIQAFAKEIDLEFLYEDLPKLLDSMKIGAQRIREIVTSLRNFSRMDEAQMKKVDIHQGLDSTLMILENRIKVKSERPQIEIIKNYGNLPHIDCYPGQLNQVFMNILVNALDALEESIELKKQFNSSPQIQIFTELAELDKIKIRIIDNGIGIPFDIKDKLFNPFFTTKSVGKGTGMGLSISYQIITQRHGGSLECISQPGERSEFLITIPIHQE